MRTELRSISKLYLFILIVLFVISACTSTQPVDQSNKVIIDITLKDSTNNETIEGADIYINNIKSQQKTPATIDYLNAGQYHIQIVPFDTEYKLAERIINILAADSIDMTLYTSKGTPTGQINISSNQPNARIYINDNFWHFESPLSLAAVSGRYKISSFLDGYKSDSPAIEIVDLFPNQEVSINLNLSEAEIGLSPGNLPPAFNLVSDLGDSCSLAQFRGNVTLLNFSGFRCSACITEIPEIQQVYEEYYSDGFRALIINVGWQNEGPADFHMIRCEMGVSVPLYYADNLDVNTTDLYQIDVTPTNFLINRNGLIVQQFGAIDYENLRAKVEEILYD